MEKRLLLAVTLSILVLVSWSALAPKPQPIANKLVASTQLSAPLPPKEAPADKLFTFAGQRYEIIFIEPQAAIKEIIFKDYQSSRLKLNRGFLSSSPEEVFTKTPSAQNTARFVCRSKDKEIIKTFEFNSSNYTIELEIETRYLTASSAPVEPAVALGGLNFAGDPNAARFQDITVSTLDKIIRPNPRRDAVFSAVKFLGLRNQYFCAVIEPVEPSQQYGAKVNKLSPQESEISLLLPAVTPAAGQNIKQKFHIYLGPQELQYINQANPEWSIVMHYGAFNVIAHLLLQALGAIYRLVHNWGWAIIILSTLVYLLLFPLTLKQMRSMKEMQALQPRIEELRQAHKDNPRKLNKAMMELYREHKVNPLGGCLPLVLQMPIFFALYQSLIRAIALKGAKFLWIKDLSEPDRLFTTPVEINILPIVMAIGMWVQQKTSLSATSAGSSAQQQKLMLVLFPVMFGLIFYRMPAGLVLYWLVNSMLMLFYQLRISRTHESK